MRPALTAAGFSPIMDAKTANIADIPVMSNIDFLRRRTPVTQEQFDREKLYGAAMAISRAMLSKGLSPICTHLRMKHHHT